MDNHPHQQHKTLKTRLASCTNTRVKSAFKYRPSNPIKLSIRSDIPFRGLSDPLTAPIFCRIRGTWDDVPRGVGGGSLARVIVCIEWLCDRSGCGFLLGIWYGSVLRWGNAKVGDLGLRSEARCGFTTGRE